MPNSAKSGSRSPRFFCENCGTEVPRDKKNCPKCGRYFSSVRCPSCGFTGEEALFKDGCPVCGYSSKAAPAKKGGLDLSESLRFAQSLPPWVFILTAVGFFAMVFAIFFTILS
jgi:uncharacterized membrane protein YvbJ